LLAIQVGQANTLGLLLTRYTAAALCLANRQAGVRAVTAQDAATVRRSAKSVGANLLVADPEAGSLFALRQMATEFCRDGVRQCPEVFRKRLG
jgi:ribose 5-phosphate isomerase RpiB